MPENERHDMDESRRVMLIECDQCANYAERTECPICGLTGPELVELRKYLPATVGFLIGINCKWSGHGAVYQ